MALTDHERARLRARWSSLIDHCQGLTHTAAFKPLALEALQWTSPLERREDAFVLFALARLADAHARAPVSSLALREPALIQLAGLARRLLGEDPPPPRLPFRADIDG